MKNKLVALLMVLTFLVALVATLPVTAEPHVKEQFHEEGSGTAEWTTDQAYTGDWSVRLATVAPGDYAAVAVPHDGKIEEITSISFWYKHEAYDEWPGPRLAITMVKDASTYLAVSACAKESYVWKEANSSVDADWDTYGGAGEIWWYGTLVGTTYTQIAGPITFDYLKTELAGADVMKVAVYMGVVDAGVGAGTAYIDGIAINGIVLLDEPTVLYVDPVLTEVSAPALGYQFPVKVNVTNVQDLYGFQFKLTWDPALLKAKSAVHHGEAIWGAGKFFQIVDFNPTLGYYEVAVTSLTVGVNGDFDLATIIFEVATDPIWDYGDIGCPIAFEYSILGDSAGQAIPHVSVDGQYINYQTQPEIKVFFNDQYSDEFNATKPQTFVVDVNVTKAVQLIRFEIQIDYNTALLDVIEAQIVPFIPPPYVIFSYQIDEEGGHVSFVLKGKTPATGDGKIAMITFNVTQQTYWKTIDPGILSCDIQPVQVKLYSTKAEILMGPALCYKGLYRYTPVPGDLNADGQTNVLDLITVSWVFGETGIPCWIKEDINADGTINVLDLIIVARHFTL